MSPHHSVNGIEVDESQWAQQLSKSHPVPKMAGKKLIELWILIPAHYAVCVIANIPQLLPDGEKLHASAQIPSGELYTV